MFRNKYLIFVLSTAVGGLFIWAGYLKVVAPLEFAQSIMNYRVFPMQIAFLLAVTLPWIEMISGAFLIIGVFRRASAFIISVLLFGFIILIVVTIAQGISVDCGCFGNFSRKADFKLLAEDIVLFLFSVTILYSKAENLITNKLRLKRNIR